MRRMVWSGASLMLLGACSGGSSEAVGENSAGSIKTTAVGEVVATPSPTATPTAAATDAATNAADVAANTVDAAAATDTDAADDTATTH